jgi:hypothetical protein
MSRTVKNLTTDEILSYVKSANENPTLKKIPIDEFDCHETFAKLVKKRIFNKDLAKFININAFIGSCGENETFDYINDKTKKWIIEQCDSEGITHDKYEICSFCKEVCDAHAHADTEEDCKDYHGEDDDDDCGKWAH